MQYILMLWENGDVVDKNAFLENISAHEFLFARRGKAGRKVMRLYDDDDDIMYIRCELQFLYPKSRGLHPG